MNSFIWINATMSIVLDLSPEEEADLRRAAEAQGQEVTDYIKTLVLATARNIDSEAEERRAMWQKWDAAGRAATEEARRELHAQGIGVVYGLDGVVVEELPDGTIRPLKEAA
jgi:phosphoglycerate dehydrogenase-like enzyme